MTTLRPTFARTRDAIEAHLTIVFTALAVSREVQTRVGSFGLVPWFRGLEGVE